MIPVNRGTTNCNSAEFQYLLNNLIEKGEAFHGLLSLYNKGGNLVRFFEQSSFLSKCQREPWTAGLRNDSPQPACPILFSGKKLNWHHFLLVPLQPARKTRQPKDREGWELNEKRTTQKPIIHYFSKTMDLKQHQQQQLAPGVTLGGASKLQLPKK